MGYVNFKVLHVSKQIYQGMEMKYFHNESSVEECAQFVRDENPKGELGVKKRFFTIDLVRNYNTPLFDNKKEKITLQKEIIMWWYHYLKKTIGLKYLEIIGFEKEKLILTLDIPIGNHPSKEQEHHYALIEFALIRFSWGYPYRLVINNLYNIRKEVKNSDYDLIQLFFVYHNLVMHLSFETLGLWSTYFSLIGNASVIRLYNEKQFSEIMSWGKKNHFKYFSRCNLFLIIGFDKLKDVCSVKLTNDQLNFSNKKCNWNSLSEEDSLNNFKQVIKIIDNNQVYE